MPDFIQKTHNGLPTGETDWSKIFMGFAMALVFVMQQWHSIEVSDIKASMVPRAEIQAHTQNFRREFKEDNDKFMNRTEILDAFRDFSKRIEFLEEEKGSTAGVDKHPTYKHSYKDK